MLGIEFKMLPNGQTNTLIFTAIVPWDNHEWINCSRKPNRLRACLLSSKNLCFTSQQNVIFLQAIKEILMEITKLKIIN